MLMGINSLVFSLIRVFLRGLLPSEWFEVDYWLTYLQSDELLLPALDLDPDRAWSYLLGGLFLLFLYTVVFWVIVTVAEGGIIGAVNDESAGRRARMGSALGHGFRLLGRFAAIDAAVFLPLFIWLLIMLFVGMIDTFLVGFLTVQGQADAGTAVAIFTIGWACVLILGCLIPPIALISLWYRTLAFRDAAVLDHSVREAMRHTRQVLRQHVGELIGLTAFLYGVGYMLSWLTSLLSWPILALTAVPLAAGFSSAAGVLAMILNLLITLLVAFLKGILHAFTAVAWTIAYRRLTIEKVHTLRIDEE